MATQKVVFIFGNGAAGWTETYYFADRDADPDNSVTVAMDLAKLRAALLAGPSDALVGAPAPVKLEAVRVTNVDAPNVSTLRPASVEVRDANSGNPSAMMGTRTAVLTMFTADKAQHRRLGLRGLPSAWLRGNLDDRHTAAQTADLRAKLDKFRDSITGKAGGIAISLKVEGWAPRTGQRGVTAVGVEAVTNNWKVTLPGLVNPFPVTSRIKIRGLRGKGLNGLAGTHKVLAVSGDVYTLNTPRCGNCATFIKVPGEVLGLTSMAFPRVTEAFLTGYGQHATGRAFFGRHARRKTTCNP